MSTSQFKPGDKVAIYVHQYGEATAETVTIARETKTQLIVGGDGSGSVARVRRFRKSDRTEVGGRGAWSPTARLLPLDDPAVIRAQEAQKARRIFARTIGAVRAWEKDRGNVEAIDAAITALTNYRHYTTKEETP